MLLEVHLWFLKDCYHITHIPSVRIKMCKFLNGRQKEKKVISIVKAGIAVYLLCDIISNNLAWSWYVSCISGCRKYVQLNSFNSFEQTQFFKDHFGMIWIFPDAKLLFNKESKIIHHISCHFFYCLSMKSPNKIRTMSLTNLK